MNALQIIQQACGELGITVPNAAASSSDAQVVQLFHLLNAAGRSLARRYDWQALITEKDWLSVAGEDQGSLAEIIGGTAEKKTDAAAKILNETLWNRSTRLPICGPKSPQGWQAAQAVNVGGPYHRYRLRGGRLLITPALPAGQTLAMEYVSSRWAISEDRTELQDAFLRDDDCPRISDALLVLELKWRWLKAKGFDYAEEFGEAEAAIVDAMAKDGTKAVMRLDGCATEKKPGIFVSPGSWPLS